MTTEDTWGVNYRALRDLFQLSEARKDFIKYEVGVQMIEIYNEQVRDLLVIDGSNRRYPYSCFPLMILVLHFLVNLLLILLRLDNQHVRYTK